MNPLLGENNDWRMITSVLTDVLDAQFGVTVLPNHLAGQVRPVIENLSAEKYRLVIPIGEEAGKPMVAVGTLEAKPSEILEKLLGLAVRHVRQSRQLDEQRLDLDAYVHQVSRDFEELSWLRGLIQHLKQPDEVADSGGHGAAGSGGRCADSAENLVHTILLPLSKLVGAQEIVLVSADPQGASPGQDVPPVGKAIARVGPGEQVVDDQSCCKLVDRLRDVAGTRPLVQTGMKRRREFSMVPGVDCCILVPAMRQESMLGWLLAVNRLPATSVPTADWQPDPAPVCPRQTGNVVSNLPDDEFGTFETNLLDFAAVVLAAHARCAELFGHTADA